MILSIAVPTYNRVDKLRNMLDTLLPQTNEFNNEIEICISNNGSTDKTRDYVKELQKSYPIIKYRENEVNMGVDYNILKVVGMCDGDYVWTFSDDDYIVSDGLKQVIEFLKDKKWKSITKENITERLK